jgi:hypothetical protein
MIVLGVALWACNCDGRSYRTLREAPQPPSTPGIALRPAVPRTGDDLVVELTNPSMDGKGLDVVYRYVWSKNDAVETDLTADRVPASRTAKGERWNVSVVATNLLVDAEPVTAGVTIGNTPPGTDLAFVPARPDALTGIHVVPATGDPDGDSVHCSYAWAMDGLPHGVDTHRQPKAAR